VLRTAFSGSSYVGVFLRATDQYVLVRHDVDDAIHEELGEEFGATVVPTRIGGATIVGALAAGNENGLVVSGRSTERERESLESELGVPVAELEGPANAAGNVILATDSAAFVHEDLPDAGVETVRETLDVPVERGSLAGTRAVGTAAVANSRGVLCHPDATDAQMDALEDHFGVPVDVGTVNYGSRMVGSGVAANDTGYVAGSETTGPELGRIESALGFVTE
jgi:translation initiation factor 6